MSEIPENAEVTLEFKRAGVRGYIEITVDGVSTKADVEDDDDESAEVFPVDYPN